MRNCILFEKVFNMSIKLKTKQKLWQSGSQFLLDNIYIWTVEHICLSNWGEFSQLLQDGEKGHKPHPQTNLQHGEAHLHSIYCLLD